jgi:CHAT domain-containing protein
VLAAGGGEDGLVGPAELARLDLAADLVVLSACRTSRGRVMSGEGVDGFASPLLEAGARAVVATAWELEDKRGMRLVSDLYARLAKGAAVGDALQAAKLAAYHRGESPRTWAVLALVGDPLVRPWR